MSLEKFLKTFPLYAYHDRVFTTALLWAGELAAIRNATPNVRMHLKNFSNNNSTLTTSMAAIDTLMLVNSEGYTFPV